jgi:uncharacterized membrane protein (GlpM family)
VQTIIKVVLSVVIILAATAVGKKLPSTAGLVGVMPLTGALVLVWMYLESNGDAGIMQQFTKGALWGIVPSILFFVVALLCFKRGFPLSIALVSSFGAWLGGALIHQWFLK